MVAIKDLYQGTEHDKQRASCESHGADAAGSYRFQHLHTFSDNEIEHLSRDLLPINSLVQPVSLHPQDEFEKLHYKC